MSIRRTAANRGQPDVTVDFDHHESAPRRVRRALEPLIATEGDPIANDVRLVVSELVSNVVQHTRDGGIMRAWDPKPDVPFRLEVADPDERGAACPTTDDHGGRGLQIVNELADDWGVERTDRGKTVWAEFDRIKASVR